jgi:hypothetical protein
MDYTNSFYYFFSATPQVIAAILGLFGILVIFKLQSAKSSLLGYGESILNVIKYEINGNLTEGTLNSTIKSAIQNAIHQQSINGLEKAIFSITIKNEKITQIQKAFVLQKDVSNNLIRFTIIMSITSSLLIGLCLAIIPFGQAILKSNFTYIIFAVVTALVVLTLVGFIGLLRSALKSWEFS